MSQKLVAPKEADLVNVRDLAAPLDVTPAAVYLAAKRGFLPVIHVGALKKMTRGAFDYHRRNGYGPNVPPYRADSEPAA